LEALIRIPDGAQINEPWATNGKASADMVEIIQIWDVKTGKDVTEKYREKAMHDKEYELSTFKDVFDKVPFDRISNCMSEISILIRQARAASEFVEEVAKSAFPDKGNLLVHKFPDKIIWKDDKQGDLTMRLKINNQEIFMIKSKMERPNNA
jgi:hypothetical protein